MMIAFDVSIIEIKLQISVIFKICCRLLQFDKIRGTTAPKSQDRLKWLLPHGSTGARVVSKALTLDLNFSFLTRISLHQVATQLASRGWVDPVPDPILPEKFLGYSRESNPGPLG